MLLKASICACVPNSVVFASRMVCTSFQVKPTQDSTIARPTDAVESQSSFVLMDRMQMRRMAFSPKSEDLERSGRRRRCAGDDGPGNVVPRRRCAVTNQFAEAEQLGVHSQLNAFGRFRVDFKTHMVTINARS